MRDGRKCANGRRDGLITSGWGKPLFAYVSLHDVMVAGIAPVLGVGMGFVRGDKEG